jgi:hypothetical protein
LGLVCLRPAPSSRKRIVPCQGAELCEIAHAADGRCEEMVYHASIVVRSSGRTASDCTDKHCILVCPDLRGDTNKHPDSCVVSEFRIIHQKKTRSIAVRCKDVTMSNSPWNRNALAICCALHPKVAQRCFRSRSERGMHEVACNHHASASFASFAVHSYDVLRVHPEPSINVSAEFQDKVQWTRVVIIERIPGSTAAELGSVVTAF